MSFSYLRFKQRNKRLVKKFLVDALCIQYMHRYNYNSFFLRQIKIYDEILQVWTPLFELKIGNFFGLKKIKSCSSPLCMSHYSYLAEYLEYLSFLHERIFIVGLWQILFFIFFFLRWYRLCAFNDYFFHFFLKMLVCLTYSFDCKSEIEL